MLLPELIDFTNLGLPATKFWQSENNMFRLQVLKPLIDDVADPLVPHVDIRFDLTCFFEHGDDKATPVPALLQNYSAFFLDEAPKVHKPHLYPLVNDLPDQHQVLCDCRNI